MTYTIQVGNGGYVGWKVLERTMSRQREAFSRNTSTTADRSYFIERMPNVRGADDLIRDYRLMAVTLRAFGLDADINNKFFIKKVLESNPDDRSSLVNRLSDKRYLKLNQALGLNHSEVHNATRVQTILAQYEERSFEKNIGERYPEIELALNAQRELPQIASLEISENAKWYQILGSKPLRQIFEKAYGLGSNFSSLPIDRQLMEIKSKAKINSGNESVGQFQAAETRESLLRRYLLRNHISVSSESSSFTTALTILRS